MDDTPLDFKDTFLIIKNMFECKRIAKDMFFLITLYTSLNSFMYFKYLFGLDFSQIRFRNLSTYLLCTGDGKSAVVV